MRLGLPPPAVALGVLVADLVGQIAAKEPDEGRGGHHRQDDEPQLCELELEAEDDGGGVLGRGGEGADEDGVEGDDPEHVGEESGLNGLDDGAPAQVPLEGHREEAKVVLVGAVAVPGVVEAGAHLAGAEGVYRASSFVLVLDQVAVGKRGGGGLREGIHVYIPSSSLERSQRVSGTKKIMAIHTMIPAPAVM